MTESSEDNFYEKFYNFCKVVFYKCCNVEKKSFFPKFEGELNDITENDIHHENLYKDFFIKEINANFLFDNYSKLTILKANDNEENKCTVNLLKLYERINVMLPKVKTFSKFVKINKDDLQSSISDELYILQFEVTNNEDSKKETGIELPSYSFSVYKRKQLREAGCLKLYDAIEYLREMKYFAETTDYEHFFLCYISNLYNNYNLRKAPNKKEIKLRNDIRNKIKREINELSLDDDYIKEFREFLDNKESYKIIDELKILRRDTNLLSEKDIDILYEIEKLQADYLGIGERSLDEPLYGRDGEVYTLKDKIPDDNLPSPEEEYCIRAAPKELQDLVEKYLEYVHVNHPRDDTLDTEIIIKIHKDIIRLLFSVNPKYDFTRFTERELRRKMRNELEKKYNQKYRRELENVLKINATNHNVLKEILNSFRKRLGRINGENEKQIEEINELRNYITNIQDYLRRTGEN